jgi:hypothetical protein
MENVLAHDGTNDAFHPALIRKLILSRTDAEAGNGKECSKHVRKTMTHEATIAVGAILQLFVQEAVHRASIEAEIEFESETKEPSESKKSPEKIPIRADHISKIAAELLMDFT